MATARRPALARTVTTDAAGADVLLSDGRQLRVLFDRYPFLRGASASDRRRCRVDDDGMAIWWPSLHDGISVAGLLGVSEAALEGLIAQEGGQRRRRCG